MDAQSTKRVLQPCGSNTFNSYKMDQSLHPV